MYAAIKHLAKHLNDLKPDAAEAERQHVCAQQHHRANLRLRQRLTYSTGVAANKIELKLGQRIALDANIGELAESRRDAIDRRITRDDFFDKFTRRQNTWVREIRNLNRFATEGHGSDVSKCQSLAV